MLIIGLAFAQIPDQYPNAERFGPLLILLGVVAMLSLLAVLTHWLAQRPRLTRLLTWVVVLVSVGLQIFLAFHVVGDNIYDGMDTRFQAVNLFHGSRQWLPYFYELAKNNVPITLIQAGLLSLFDWLHVNVWIGLNLAMFVWIDITIGLLWFWLKQRLGTRYALVFLILAAIYFPFYGNALFFYTDGVALLFPALTLVLLHFYLQAQQQRWLLLVFLGIELWLGFWIKGNNGILLIAVLLVILAAHLQQGWRRSLTAVLLLLALFGVGNAASPQIAAAFGYQQPLSKKMPLTTWTMIGLNYQSQGSSSYDDTTTVQAQPTYAKKQALVNTEIKQRLTRKGVTGVVGHLLNKANLMWSDGNLDATETINQATHYGKLFQLLYGSKKVLISSLNQIVYASVLILSLLAVMGFRKLATIDLELKFILLTFLGVFSFHLFFWEAEARYALLIFPFLLLLAMFGLAQLNVVKVKQLIARQGDGGRLTVSLALVAIATVGVLSARQFVEAPTTVHVPVVQQTKDYGTYRLRPGETLRQQIWLPKIANALSIQNPRKSGTKHIRAEVISGTKRQRMKASATGWHLNRLFKKGQHTLVLKNRSNKPVKLAILDSRSYNAVPLAKPVNQNQWHKKYLLFKVQQKWQQPLISAKLLATLVGVSLVITLGFLWYPFKQV